MNDVTYLQGYVTFIGLKKFTFVCSVIIHHKLINSTIMKKTGMVLIVIGLLLSIITGFNFFTKKKVVDIGKLEITQSEPHRVKWSPYAGVGIMIVGGIMLLVGSKKTI